MLTRGVGDWARELGIGPWTLWCRGSMPLSPRARVARAYTPTAVVCMYPLPRAVFPIPSREPCTVQYTAILRTPAPCTLTAEPALNQGTTGMLAERLTRPRGAIAVPWSLKSYSAHMQPARLCSSFECTVVCNLSTPLTGMPHASRRTYPPRRVYVCSDSQGTRERGRTGTPCRP